MMNNDKNVPPKRGFLPGRGGSSPVQKLQYCTSASWEQKLSNTSQRSKLKVKLLPSRRQE
jgi:hypothetical protein